MSAVLEFQAAPGKPVLRGHAFFWEVICEIGAKSAPFSVYAIHQRTNRTEWASVKDFIRRLEKAGYVEATGDEEVNPSGHPTPFYRLIRLSATAPQINRDGSEGTQGRGQQQMWNVLRGPESRSGISAADLSLRASTDEVPVTVETARAYVHRLSRAGYLIRPRYGLWRLQPAMNTGPKPPLILRSKIVFDQNKGRAMAPIVAEEDRP